MVHLSGWKSERPLSGDQPYGSHHQHTFAPCLSVHNAHLMSCNRTAAKTKEGTWMTRTPFVYVSPLARAKAQWTSLLMSSPRRCTLASGAMMFTNVE